MRITICLYTMTWLRRVDDNQRITCFRGTLRNATIVIVSTHSAKFPRNLLLHVHSRGYLATDLPSAELSRVMSVAVVSTHKFLCKMLLIKLVRRQATLEKLEKFAPSFKRPNDECTQEPATQFTKSVRTFRIRGSPSFLQGRH
jgi:hypothetical protein